MELPISFNAACASRSPVARRQPGEGRACGNTLDPSKKEKQKRDADRKHDIPPPAERDVDEGDVIGEAERPPPPSEKPEAS